MLRQLLKSCDRQIAYFSIGRFSESVCVSRNLLVNALVIVNAWALQSGFLSLRVLIYCKRTRFCVDVSLLGENVRLLCAYQSKFIRFGFAVLLLVLLSTPVLVVSVAFVVLVAFY